MCLCVTSVCARVCLYVVVCRCVCVHMCEHMCVYIYVMCVRLWEDWQGLSSEAEKKKNADVHVRIYVCKASAGVCGRDAGSGLCSPQSSSPGMDERGKESHIPKYPTRQPKGAGSQNACGMLEGIKRANLAWNN